MFNKYICPLTSIQKQFWLSRLLLCQQLPNGRETVSLPCGFGEDPLHTHPESQSLQKYNNSNHLILSLECGPKSSNLKCCNQVILEASQCSSQIWTSTSASGSFTLDWRWSTMRWSTMLHECEIIVPIHNFIKSSRRCFR